MLPQAAAALLARRAKIELQLEEQYLQPEMGGS